MKQELTSFPALVIRESDYGENDKLLTLLTAEKGRMTVLFKGGKSLKNKNSASSQLLCYSEFTVKERNGFFTLSEAALIQQFFELRSSLDRFALSQYIADVCGEVSVENENGEETLSLALNTLYMLCREDTDTDFIKAVFELRCMALNGFCPDLTACPLCGKQESDIFYLDVMNGSLRCGDCFGSDEDIELRKSEGQALMIIPLSRSVLAAMRYVIGSPSKRIFSFKLEEDELEPFCRVCERYLTNHLERGFKTLDFYKNIKKLDI